MKKRYAKIVVAFFWAAAAVPVGSVPRDVRAEAAAPPGKDGAKKAENRKKVELKKHFPTKQLEKGEDVKWNHAPYNIGKCSLCHESDDLEKPGPMRASVNTICLSCHIREKRYLKRRKEVHEPVAKDCGYCHNAHNSKYKSLLYRPMEELCTACHEDQKKELAARVQHEPVIQQKRCENCHDSHATNREKLLIAPEGRLCIACHGDKEIVKDERGRPLANIEALRRRPVKHEPFAKDDCSDCHNSHGSDHFRLLIASHPPSFYASYSDAKYGLCYECHRKERITEPTTTSLTGFRDGKQNLHYTHVVKPEDGRTCRSCHEDHATNNPHLIRSAVPYGTSGWMLPLYYTATETGGTCKKTCHDNESYDNGGARPSDVAAAYKRRKAREKENNGD